MKLEIADRARLARDGFMTQTVDCVTTGMRPAFDCALLPQPKIHHTQWDHGDTTSRALLAWLYVREITGDDQAGREVENGLWQHLQSILHPQTGLACVPEHSAADHGRYYYHLWDQGRVLRYLVARLRIFQFDKAEKKRLLVLIRRLQAGLRHLATPWQLANGKTALSWTSDVFWNDSTTLPNDRDFGAQNWTGWCIVTSQLIEPQTMLAEITGDGQDLETALMFARGFLAGYEQRRQSTMPMFAADGHFRGHFHGAVSGLLGLVKLAQLLWAGGATKQATEWIALATRAYRWIFSPERNVNPGCSCGYFPETAADVPHSSSELCCTADMVELAIELAQCADLDAQWTELSDLWDDVERFTRNEIFKMQFTRVEKIWPHVITAGNMTAAQARQCLQKLLGTWGSCRNYLPDAGWYRGRLQLNLPSIDNRSRVSDETPMLTSGGCCAYSGVRALHAAWKQSVVTEQCLTSVRIPSRHEDQNVVLQPIKEGGIAFNARSDHRLRIRISPRIKFDTVRVAGQRVQDWSVDKRWLTLTLQNGERGTVRWPAPLWSTREVAGPINHLGLWPDTKRDERLACVLDYRGNELTSITPAAIKLSYLDGL